MNAVRLSGAVVTIADVVAVARDRSPVIVEEAVFARLERARGVLDAAASSGQRIYGLNTGLGGNLGTDIFGDASAFQRQLLEGRSGAMGEPLAVDLARATMMARASMLSAGGSGISTAVFAALVAALNAGVHPVMPSLGSIGAGDLVLMTALARLLIGDGGAEYGGQHMPAAVALAAAGLVPVPLVPKDGLSLINASSVSVGHAALAVADARTAFAQQQQAAALTTEGLAANLGTLDPRVQKLRPAFGQEDAAAGLRELLAGAERPAASVIQDPLSIRCHPGGRSA